MQIFNACNLECNMNVMIEEFEFLTDSYCYSFIDIN